jgi:nitroreductase
MDQQVLRGIVEQAARAPSIHNTQPWLFATHGDVIELHADPSRGLAVLDPTGRARQLSCGAALFHARVAAAAAGFRTDVTVLPEPADENHLADLRVEAGSPGDEEDLADAIPVRRTAREAFAPGALDEDVVRALNRAAETEGCWLRLVDSPPDATRVAVLLARADEEQRADPAYVEELRRWSARPDDEVEGVPTSAIPDVAPSERATNFRLRDFVADRESEPADPHAGDDPPAVERPLVSVLGTRDDDARAWIAAGQGLARLLLVAASEGVAASPMTQPLEIPSIRQQLGKELGLVGHPQMILRLGYTAEDGSRPKATPRRPLDEILTED